MKTILRKGESGYLISKEDNRGGCPSCRKATQKELNINRLFKSRIKDRLYEAKLSTPSQSNSQSEKNSN